MNGLFITGTDTNIGKTALSALLLAELRRRNIDAAPMKPAQTGCKKKDEERNLKPEFPVSPLSVPDLDYSLSMAGMSVSEEDYALMAPYCFEPACSPHLAAERAGVEIELPSIGNAVKKLAKKHDVLIVEGAGGILVPLNRRELMLDLMKALNFPVLLAARPGLGTINHTLLSIHALRAAGLDIAGVVFVESEKTDSGFIEKDNHQTIEQFGNVPVLGKIPYCPQLRDPNPDYSALPVPVVAEIERVASQLSLGA